MASHLRVLVRNQEKTITLVSQVLLEQNTNLLLYLHKELVFENDKNLKSRKPATSKIELFLTILNGLQKSANVTGSSILSLSRPRGQTILSYIGEQN